MVAHSVVQLPAVQKNKIENSGNKQLIGFKLYVILSSIMKFLMISLCPVQDVSNLAQSIHVVYSISSLVT